MKRRRAAVVFVAGLMLAGAPARALTVAASVAVAPKPELIAVNPIKNFVYVASYGAAGPGGDLVTVLDASGPVPIAVGSIPVGVDPYGIDANPLTNKIYVANFGSGSVSVIDESIAPPSVKTIPGIPKAAGVAVNVVTNRVYVVSAATGSLHVIDGLTDSVAAVVPVTTASKAPLLVEVNPVLNRIYVPEWLGGALHVLDGFTNTVVASIPLPPFAYGSVLGGVAIHPVTQDVYVTNEKGGVYLVNGLTHALKAMAPVGLPGALPFGTWGIEVNALKGHAYIAQFHTNTVHIVDAMTLAPLGFVATGPIPTPPAPTSGPHFTALNPLDGKLYVTNELAGTVSVVTDP